jgi:hypothetical protein
VFAQAGRDQTNVSSQNCDGCLPEKISQSQIATAARIGQLGMVAAHYVKRCGRKVVDRKVDFDVEVTIFLGLPGAKIWFNSAAS